MAAQHDLARGGVGAQAANQMLDDAGLEAEQDQQWREHGGDGQCHAGEQAGIVAHV